jgi:PAS domain S-box-containing protein
MSLLSANLIAGGEKKDRIVHITLLEKKLEDVITEEKPAILNEIAREYLSIDAGKTKEFAQEAIELSRVLENTNEQLNAFYFLGEAYYYLEEYKLAIDTYSSLLELLQNSNRDTLISETCLSMGLSFDNINNQEEALLYLQKSLEIEEKLGRQQKIAADYFYLGNVYYNLNDFQSSIRHHNLSLEIYTELGEEKWISNVRNTIGTIYADLGSFEKALEHYKSSLTIEEKTNDKQGMAQTLNNIGIVYYEWNHKEKALEYYQKSLMLEKELENRVGEAGSYNNIGIIYSDWEQDKIALDYYQKALSIYEEFHHSNGIANAVNNMGESYFKLGDHELALEYLFRSLKYEQEDKNLLGIASSYHTIGEVYFKLRKPKEALDYNNRSFKIAESHQLSSILLLNYKLFYEIYSFQNNPIKALKNYKLYADQKDTVYSRDFHKNIAELQAKFEIDKIDREKELFAKKFKKKDKEVKTQRIYLVIIFFLMIVFGILVYYDIRSKITANNKLRAINEELTDQKEQLTTALDKLGKSESKYKTLIENSPTGILYVNSDGSIQEINNKMLEILGSPDEQLTKKINCITFPPLQRIGLSEQLSDCLEKGKNIYDEKIYFSKWKKKTYLRYFITPVFDRKKNVRNAIINVEDITHSKEAQESKERSEEKYRILVENSLQAMVIIQEDGLIFANSRMEELTQYSFNELVEKGPNWIKDFIHPDDLERVSRILNESFKNQRIPERNEMRIFRKDRKIRWVETLGTLVNFQGKDAILLVAMDITDKKEAQAVLVESEKTLRNVNAMKDKFFSIIAHDLKNPFNAIIGFSNLLYEAYDNFDEQQRKSFIKNICDASESTFKLLQNLLEWARTQTGSFEFIPETIDLSIITNENISVLKSSADNKKIEIKSNIPYNSIVFADENMTKAIIRNLISNAIKFTNEEGKVDISVIKNKNMMQVTVADNGTGISKENISRLFRIDDPFKAPGTANEQGTGLGLILCKEFVEKNGGKIWVESEIGVGSRFIFTLPLRKSN